MTVLSERMTRERVEQLGIWATPVERGPLPPHPEPLLRATRAPGALAGIHGWGTLAKRLGPGWALSELRAVGWRVTFATGNVGGRGPLVESIAVRFGHASTRARAVAVIERRLDEAQLPDWRPLDGKRGAWSYQRGYVWVSCVEHAAPLSNPQAVGSRVLLAALKIDPTLDASRMKWIIEEEKTDDE